MDDGIFIGIWNIRREVLFAFVFVFEGGVV